MEIISEGIAVFEDVFLRNEEVIDLAEESRKWRAGTAGQTVDPEVRITDIHDLDPETELHSELLETFIDCITQYRLKYPACIITSGEALRVGRYGKDGHYSIHSDSRGSERVLSGILYLNDEYKGGELNFQHQDITLKPKSGSLILFPSNYIYIHQSLPVLEGSKYIVLSWFK